MGARYGLSTNSCVKASVHASLGQLAVITELVISESAATIGSLLVLLDTGHQQIRKTRE